MLPVLKYNGAVIAKKIELRRTIFEQSLGLMFRKTISPDYSMIFVFKNPSRVCIHMLFVFFAIDVIFLDMEKKVNGFSRLKPWIGYKTMANTGYVLEMKAGAIDRFNIFAGGKMEFDEN